VLLAHKISGEIENRHLLPPLELDLSVFVLLADNTVHFDHAFVVDQIEDRFVLDRLPNTLFAQVIFRLKQSHDSFHVIWFYRDYNVDVAGHSRLRVIIHRHRTGEHVTDPALLEFVRNITHDINFGRHSFTLSEWSFWEKRHGRLRREGSGRAERERARYNGAFGKSDMAGYAAREAASERGRRASFNGAGGKSDPPSPRLRRSRHRTRRDRESRG